MAEEKIVSHINKFCKLSNVSVKVGGTYQLK